MHKRRIPNDCERYLEAELYRIVMLLMINRLTYAIWVFKAFYRKFHSKISSTFIFDSLDMISHSKVPKSLKFNFEPIQKVAIISKLLFHITFY